MTKRNISITIPHLTRVEGHGNISIRVENGQLIEASWEVIETPRFFEVMLKGMSADQVPFLTSRICGICSISHSLASIRALERAMEITPPPIAISTRLLAMHGETLQSHALHLFFLYAPDFAGTDSILPLFETHPDLAVAGLKLKELGNTISRITTGRCTHPVSLVPGGINKAPDRSALATLLEELQQAKAALELATSYFESLTIPDFVRETEFISLCNGREYPSIGGDLLSSDGVRHEENDYLLMTNEYCREGSTSKFTRLSREASAAGALARLNNNYSFLSQNAKKTAARFALEPVCHNPFMNTIAQLVECVHIVDAAEQLATTLHDEPSGPLKTRFQPKAGTATGAVEAPRGILYHHFELDDRGHVVKADCIIPTTQNNANIHLDLHALAEKALKEGKDDRSIEKLCTMLVRSYDPCISCSVH